MPELPEVETISRQLKKLIVGKKIKEVKVNLSKIIKMPLADFRQALKDAIIKNINRRAKLLVFKLNNSWSMLVHLKMTGQLIYQSSVISEQLPVQNKHAHVIFQFTDGSQLLFNDSRKLGYIKLIPIAALDDFFTQEGFGPEPLAKGFALADLAALLAKRPKSRIKQFLMDQKNLAGIGNIYSDEILFFARVHPLRRNQTLKNGEIKKIFSGIKKILPEAIKLKGTSANDYVDAGGRQGKFAPKLKVYGQEGEKCVKCKSKIARIKINGRSAHFCPACQRPLGQPLRKNAVGYPC